ncbi:uncharacterized protein IWZ02DRAFT_199745 [Phyllosticta citriasiana]|uniref:uncharacterized protein n=1 Tax=Phyllosticta citriasiana TaxID=595635 RepID=UPI0030FDAB57
MSPFFFFFFSPSLSFHLPFISSRPFTLLPSLPTSSLPCNTRAPGLVARLQGTRTARSPHFHISHHSLSAIIHQSTRLPVSPSCPVFPVVRTSALTTFFFFFFPPKGKLACLVGCTGCRAAQMDVIEDVIPKPYEQEVWS